MAFNRHVYCSENSFRVINSKIVSIIDCIGFKGGLGHWTWFYKPWKISISAKKNFQPNWHQRDIVTAENRIFLFFIFFFTQNLLNVYNYELIQITGEIKWICKEEAAKNKLLPDFKLWHYRGSLFEFSSWRPFPSVFKPSKAETIYD